VIRQCLRAFADAQVTHFGVLWNKLFQRVGRRVHHTGIRVYRSDLGRDAAYVVLFVEASRSNGEDVSWSVGLNVSSERMEIAGRVEVTGDDGTRELFGHTEITSDCAQAAEFIACLSAEVCAQDRYMEDSAESGAA